MPEGDTLFRTARSLHRALAGQPVTRFVSRLANLSAVDDQTPVVGRTIEKVEARGKWCLLHLSGDLILLTHLRMNGAWHLYKPGERWQMGREHMRFALETPRAVAVGFDVPVAEFHTAHSLERSELAELGPDLLAKTFDAAEAVRRLRARADQELGPALLDQRALAGIGNIYKSEVCFVCGLSPWVRVATLSDEALAKVVAAARRLMLANVADPYARPIADYGERRTTGRINPREWLWAYGREGQPCLKCRTPIVMRKQEPNARVTFWCPKCQPG